MAKQTEIEVKVGLFISLGAGLIMLSILVLGSTENMLSSKNRYFTHFPSVDGLVPGAKVVVGGVPVGTITDIGFDSQKRDIKVSYSVTRDSADWIRKDSSAEIATQGVLGDKYLVIKTGSADQATVGDKSEIPAAIGKDLTQFLSKGDQLMVSLNNIASSLDRMLKSFEADHKSEIFLKGITNTTKNLSLISEKLNQQLDDMKLKSAINHLNGILEKIDNGQGTVGALVNDPSLFDDAKALLGSANRNRTIRNLVRQTMKENTEKAAEK